MDKYEYRVKTEQMLEYAEGKQYKKAMEIADTIDWRRVKNASMLNTVSEIYEFNGEFQKSRDILFVAYDRAPSSRKIIYRLGLLALKVKDIEEASDCYEEFVKIAPKDPNQHILKYKILKAQRSPVAEQIAALEDFKKAEYVEKWAYELASLYQEAGMTSKCLEECDDLILWFSEGKYVYQAMELKMRYKPLTPLQQEKYDSRPGAPAKPKVQKAQSVKPQQKTDSVMQTEELSLQTEDEKPKLREEKPEETPEPEQMAEPAGSELHASGEAKEAERQPEIKRSPITKIVKGATLEEALANGVAVASGLNIEEEAMVEREEELLTGVQMKIEDILQEWEEKQKVNADAIEEQKKKDEMRLSREREEAQKRREANKLEAERKALEAEAARKAREEEERAREEEKRKEEESAKAARAEALKKTEKHPVAKKDPEEQKKILESKTQRLPDDILELVEQLESRVGGSDIEENLDDDDLDAEVFGGAENDFAGGGFDEAEEYGEGDDFVEEGYDADDFEDDDFADDFVEERYVQGFMEAEYDEDDFADEDEPIEDPVQEPLESGGDSAEDVGFTQEESEALAGGDSEEKGFAEEGPEEDGLDEMDFEEEDFEEEPEDFGEEDFAEEDIEEEPEDFEEEDFAEEDFEEEDFEEEDFDEEDFEEADFEEADMPDDGYEEEEGYIEDYGEDDLESDGYEEDFAEEDFEEDDFGEEDFDEEDFEEEDFAEEDFEEGELEEDEFEEEEEEDFDVEKFLAENIPGKSDSDEPLEIEEPSEAEIQKRIKKSKGGVPFDTGFVVTGRYDLSATSEIGLKAGLTEEQKKLFSYFVPVRGMSEQIVEVLDNDRRAQREGTSKTGNLLVIGRKGSGKTVLAVDIVKAIQKQRNLKQGKVAIVTGDSLNKKELANIIQKLRGGAIIIEKAGKLNSRTIKELSYLMEKKTGEMLFVLEDQRKPLDRILTANPDFKRKFTSRLELPVFINDELVTFGQTYAKENGYKLDELGILALYSRIDVMQREDHAVTVAEVKEIMDEAIAHSQKANVKHLARRMFGKSTDESNRVILKEEDFKI